MDNQAIAQAGRELLGVVGRIYARRWCDGTSGNFSFVVGTNPTRLLITRTGVDKGRIQPSDLLIIDSETKPLGGTGKPSSEAGIHVAIERETGCQAILHTHSIWGTLLGEHYLAERGFSLQGFEMMKGIEGVSAPREQVFVPVVKNLQDINALSNQAASLIKRRQELRAFLIAGHGLYTWGSTLDDAYRHVEIFEFLFELTARRLADGRLP